MRIAWSVSDGHNEWKGDALLDSSVVAGAVAGAACFNATCVSYDCLKKSSSVLAGKRLLKLSVSGAVTTVGKFCTRSEPVHAAARCPEVNAITRTATNFQNCVMLVVQLHARCDLLEKSHRLAMERCTFAGVSGRCDHEKYRSSHSFLHFTVHQINPPTFYSIWCFSNCCAGGVNPHINAHTFPDFIA